MKRAKIAVLILFLIAVLCYYLTSQLDTILTDFEGYVLEAERIAVEGGDLIAASRIVEDQWDLHKRRLTRYISQYRIDDITATTVRLEPLSQLDDKAEFLAELRLLRMKINELWEAHSPSFTTLF